MPEAREAISSDLKSLLELYNVSEVSPIASAKEKIEQI